MQEAFNGTKRFLQKTLRCLESFLPEGCPKLFPISFKFSYLQNFCKNLSARRNPDKAVNKNECQTAPKEQKSVDEDCSQNVRDHHKLTDVKEAKKTHKLCGEKLDKCTYQSAQKLAQKMTEMDMMDMNDGDHVLDVEEVLQSYSLLTSPVYLDIVDKFFMDMYLDFHLPQPTRTGNSSMKKLGCSSRGFSSGSVHSSMRKLGCGGSVYGSMRKVSCPSAPGSMRKVEITSIHGSLRKVGTGSTHSSMRSLGPLKI